MCYSRGIGTRQLSSLCRYFYLEGTHSNNSSNLEFGGVSGLLSTVGLWDRGKEEEEAFAVCNTPFNNVTGLLPGVRTVLHFLAVFWFKIAFCR